MKGKKSPVLIYDLEILNAVPDRSGRREEGINYCEGWGDHKGMGIAVLACYDYARDTFRVYCQDNIGDFPLLVDLHDCVVGFNNHHFDNRVLEAAGLPIPAEKSYDLFEEIKHGLGPSSFSRYHYTLDDLCRANFRASKSGSGAHAPVLWQQGKIGTVIDYCLRDITLTKKLLDRVIRTGYLLDPNCLTRRIPVRRPGAQQ